MCKIGFLKLDVPDFVGKVLRRFERRDFSPLRLINANLIEDGRELVSIFSIVNTFRISSQDLDASILKSKRDILG